MGRRKKNEVDKLNESLDAIHNNQLSAGERTRKILKKKGIVSPSLKGMILVSTNPNTWKVPKKKK